MVGWHHWLNGHEFEQALGDGKGQGRLACYHLWGFQSVGRDYQWHKGVDAIETTPGLDTELGTHFLSKRSGATDLVSLSLNLLISQIGLIISPLPTSQGFLEDIRWDNLGELAWQSLQNRMSHYLKALAPSHSCILGQDSSCSGEKGREENGARNKGNVYSMRRNAVKGPSSLCSGGHHYARMGSAFST